MTQFEYVSVAIALVYSFAVSRLIAALPSVFVPESRDWIHALWAIILLFAAVFTWWSIWSYRDVQWTALRFVWALSVPALIHVRIGILVSDQPRAVSSWREHYEKTRVPFFVVGLAIMVNLAVLPWVMGTLPVLGFHAGLVGSVVLGFLYVVAIATDQRAVQATVVTVNLLLVLLLLTT